MSSVCDRSRHECATAAHRGTCSNLPRIDLACPRASEDCRLCPAAGIRYNPGPAYADASSSKFSDIRAGRKAKRGSRSARSATAGTLCSANPTSSTCARSRAAYPSCLKWCGLEVRGRRPVPAQSAKRAHHVVVCNSGAGHVFARRYRLCRALAVLDECSTNAVSRGGPDGSRVRKRCCYARRRGQVSSPSIEW